MLLILNILKLSEAQPEEFVKVCIYIFIMARTASVRISCLTALLNYAASENDSCQFILD